MWSLPIFFAITGFANSLALSRFSGREAQTWSCHTPEPSDFHKEISHSFLRVENDARLRGHVIARAQDSIHVKVYFHVVSADPKNHVGQDALTRELKVLNDKFAPHRISFTQGGADWTTNSNWTVNTDQLGMKKALRKGSYADLNIYYIDSLGENGLISGSSTFPNKTEKGDESFFQDGCIIQSDSLPKPVDIYQSITGSQPGLLTVHEVGHWFGLYHTFQGGCDGHGDYVSDTPPEADATHGCPQSRDSCPNVDQEWDPIHNYMDFTDSECKTEFTPGQRARMYSNWHTFRAPWLAGKEKSILSLAEIPDTDGGGDLN